MLHRAVKRGTVDAHGKPVDLYVRVERTLDRAITRVGLGRSDQIFCHLTRQGIADLLEACAAHTDPEDNTLEVPGGWFGKQRRPVILRARVHLSGEKWTRVAVGRDLKRMKLSLTRKGLEAVEQLCRDIEQ